MEQNNLTLRYVEPNTPEWLVAVENKKHRAFAMLEKEGFTRHEVEQRYDAYRQDKGISFHDERLRQEVGTGQLLTWWQDDAMVAYAPVNTSRLIGSADHGVFNIADIWAQSSLEQVALEQIVTDLLDQAMSNGTPHIQLYCDHALAEASLRLGGRPIKHWFQFNVT